MSTLAVRGRAVGREVLIVASSVLTGAIAGLIVARVHGNRMAPWILGRATGLCAYVLLVAVVVLGLTLAHPRRAESGRSTGVRMRAHIVLSLLTLALMVLHVFVLATDRYAGVGWWGAVLPMGAQYRPLAVTLGVLGAWIGLLAGVTAGLAGRLPRQMWWQLHKFAAVSFVLIWLHGMYAGSDTRSLLWLYVGTGALVVLVLAGRYAARRTADPAVQEDAVDQEVGARQ